MRSMQAFRADGKCFRGAALLFTLGPAIVLAQVNSAALQSTEKPGSKAALTRREVTPPRPVAGPAVSATVELQQRNALIAAVKTASPPLATRNVVAMSAGQVVRLTDENIDNVLSKPTITAERVAQTASKVALPATLAAKLGGATEAFVLPTQFTALALGSDRLSGL